MGDPVSFLLPFFFFAFSIASVVPYCGLFLFIARFKFFLNPRPPMSWRLYRSLDFFSFDFSLFLFCKSVRRCEISLVFRLDLLICGKLSTKFGSGFLFSYFLPHPSPTPNSFTPGHDHSSPIV